MEDILYFDIAAIIILLVLLYSTFSRKVVYGRTNKYFITMLALNGIAALFDVWSEAYGLWLPIGEAERQVKEVLVCGYFLTHHLCVLIYICYLISITDTWYKIREKLFLKLILVVPYSVVFIGICANGWNHFIFYVKDNCEYVRGTGIMVIYFSTIFYMAFGVIYLLKHRRLFTKDVFCALLSIFPLEVVAIIVQYFFPHLLIEIFMTVIATMLIMINIQRPEDNIDQAVGVRNYHAYITDLKRGILNDKKMGIVIVKIMNYRSFYSILGYDAYNRLLRKIAREIRRIVKSEKLYTDLYYIDGGRFVMMFDKVARRKADLITAKIEKMLANPNLLDSLDIAAEASICYVRFPEDIDNFETMISFGEQFHVILDNPIGVNLATDMDTREFHLNNEIDEIIHDALQNHKFEMYYQPIFSIKEQRFVSAEALIRLRHEKYGFISPELMIKAAEKTGIIPQIGEFVVNSVCEFIQSEEFKKTGLEYIELNISAVEYMQANLAERIINTVKSYDVLPSQINLEITETAFVSSESAVMENVNKLSEAGFTFSLDDYGTGYSNIQRVITLPLKIVKMDKSFVDAIENPRVYGVVKNTIKMLKEMHIEIVVEGVEIDEVAQEFVDLRCDFIQGYYYSRPLPKKEFIEFCKTH